MRRAVSGPTGRSAPAALALRFEVGVFEAGTNPQRSAPGVIKAASTGAAEISRTWATVADVLVSWSEVSQINCRGSAICAFVIDQHLPAAPRRRALADD